MIKVLIVEDSKTISTLIKLALGEDSEFEVLAVAESGEDALKLTKQFKPDVITMDVVLKGKSGLWATQNIMSSCPTPIVIMSTLFDPRNKIKTMEALEKGAISVFQKPKLDNSDEFDLYARKLRNHLKMLSGVTVVKRRSPNIKKTVRRTGSKELKFSTRSGIKLIAIGSSTGGPQVLKKIFDSLQPEFNFPVVVVQHISEGFTDSLVNWLNTDSPLTVKIAEEGELLEAGKIYIAGENKHLTVNKYLRSEYIDAPPLHSCKPSVSVLFRSIVENIGGNAVSILLTGMGKDGAKELKILKDKGGITIAQDEETSIVFGMPGEAVKLDAVKYLMPPNRIIKFLNNL